MTDQFVRARSRVNLEPAGGVVYLCKILTSVRETWESLDILIPVGLDCLLSLVLCSQFRRGRKYLLSI